MTENAQTTHFGTRTVPLGEKQGLVNDVFHKVAARYDLRPGSTLLFRPDQHLVARSRTFDVKRLEAGVRRALGAELEAVA